MSRTVKRFDVLLRKGKLPKPEEVPHLSTEIKFGENELQGINANFRKQFANHNNVARVIKYLFGYEIRYRRDGYDVTVFDKELKRAKEKFRESLLA